MSTHPFDHFKYKNAPAHLDAEVADYNLKKAEEYSRYGATAAAVDAMMAAEDAKFSVRSSEGWACDEGGWYTPNEIHEFDWEHDYGYPFPEEAAWQAFKIHRRSEAGWKVDGSGCWYAPDGTLESNWTGVLPEYCVEYCEA